MIRKVLIEDIEVTPFEGKYGSTYKVKIIYDGGKFMLGFDKLGFQEFKAGNTVELDVKQNGKWTNFTLPKKDVHGNIEQKIEQHVEKNIRKHESIDEVIIKLDTLQNSMNELNYLIKEVLRAR